MKLRGLLTACALLALLSGVLWWSNRKEARASKEPVESKSAKLFTSPEDQIQEINLQRQNGEAIHLKRNSGKWQITAPRMLPADSEAVSSLLSTLSSVNADHVIDDKAASVEPYGLARPSAKVGIVESNNKTRELLIGDPTPAGTAAYAELAGDQRVFTVASYIKSSFDKSTDDLRDKRLMNFETDKVTRVELTAKKQSIEFGRNKDQWQILKPKPLRADQFPVEEMVRTLHDAKMELSASDDEKKTAAAFGSASPVATARVTDASGTQELQVRKNNDDYFAKSSAVDGVYKVAVGTGKGLDKSLDDFRNKKLFDFGYTDPEKLELHDGSKSYVLSKKDGDWWSDGKKLDESGARDLVGKIRDLSASKFVESGFTAAVLDIAVTSDAGKRSEKLLISKTGERYVAKRENEPALYELDSSAVSDLQKAAAELKPATPASAATPTKK
jgi:hypothetical protein